jgi:hypothetical protein
LQHWRLKWIESNENENMINQNLWNIAITFLRGIFIDTTVYTKKSEWPKINNLIMHLEKQEKPNSVSR